MKRIILFLLTNMAVLLAARLLFGLLRLNPQDISGLLLLSEPVAALLIDCFLLGKPIAAVQWCGAALTLFSIYLGSLKTAR